MPSTPARQDPVTRTYENLHGVPHAEIVVFTKDADGPGATGDVHNTLGLPVAFTEEQFRALDPAAPAAEFHGDAVWMNGPRRALMDAATAQLRDAGRVTSVAGIAMHSVADVHVPDLRTFLSTRRPACTRLTVGRTTGWVFLKGREIHEVVSSSTSTRTTTSATADPRPGEQAAGMPPGRLVRLPAGRGFQRLEPSGSARPDGCRRGGDSVPHGPTPRWHGCRALETMTGEGLPRGDVVRLLARAARPHPLLRSPGRAGTQAAEGGRS
ncbi:hypothetical protein [Streptomyces sp. NPDC059224]|uniref:hypothetical protein n=1 Tax=Streptomyces sp. NPDC059224 TaxID=3346775 RepID=UPI0036AD00AF